MMQPTLIIIPLAIFTKSAPKPNAMAILSGVMSLPDANILILSLTPYFSNIPETMGSAVSKGNPTPSSSSWKVAPVPPSPPSTVIKLG